jgi:hypothetical protein
VSHDNGDRPVHQRPSYTLTRAIDDKLDADTWEVYQDAGIRLKTNGVVVPDLKLGQTLWLVEPLAVELDPARLFSRPRPTRGNVADDPTRLAP